MGDEKSALQAGQFNGKSQPTTLHTGSPSIVNSLQASFDHASTYTVEFDVTGPTNPASEFDCNAEALIHWVLDGNQITRRVSVGSGTSISGTAQGVNVQLQDVTQDTGQVLNQPYTIIVSVTPGVRASQAQLAILDHLNAITLAPTVGTTIDIPADAGVIAVSIVAVNIPVVFPIVQPSLSISIETPSNDIKHYTIPGVEQGTFITVPAGTTQISITNVDPALTAQIAITWGIDG